MPADLVVSKSKGFEVKANAKKTKTQWDVYKEIIDQRINSHDCTCLWGGEAMEGYISDDQTMAILRHTEDGDDEYASITPDQFFSMQDACEWEMCGAQCCTDVSIQRAAFEWVSGRRDIGEWMTEAELCRIKV